MVVLGSFAAHQLFGDANPIGQQVLLWKQPFQVVGVVGSGSWMVAPAAGDDQFDAVYVPFTTIHQLLNLSKLNDITITAASTGEVTRVAKDVTALLRERHRIGIGHEEHDVRVADAAQEHVLALAAGIADRQVDFAGQLAEIGE